MSWSLGELSGDQRISTVLFAAVMLIPLAGLALGAVDLARYSAAQSELRAALMSASETVSAGTAGDQRQALLREHVISSVSGAIDKDSITIELLVPQPDGSGLIAEAKMRTRFLCLIGIETLRLREEVKARQPAQTMLSLMMAACVGMERNLLNTATSWRAA